MPNGRGAEFPYVSAGPASPCSCQFCLHALAQRVEATRKIAHAAIHKGSRRGARMAALTTGQMLAHALAIDFIIEGRRRKRQVLPAT